MTGRPPTAHLRRAIAPLMASALAVLPALAAGASAQESVREQLASMSTPSLDFTPREPFTASVAGVPVYFLEDHDLPLVTLYATFKGGYGRLPRDYYAAASAVPSLLRTGGTAMLPSDSVDARIEFLALQMGFGQGGGSASSWVNTLTDNLDEAVDLWRQMLRQPRFDSAQVEVWRGTELETVRRRVDDPGVLAYGRFNQIMYGDHPVGWEMAPSDLEPEDLSEERLRFVQEAVICPDDMILGMVGDLDWSRAESLAAELLDGWPPCSGALEEEMSPDIRAAPGVFVIHKELEQTVVVLAHSSGVRQADERPYYSAQIGNSILGGAGLSSRLMAELRTREGLAYGASSLWTTSRKHDGLVGAVTRTRPEAALAATRLILQAMDSMRTAPPTDAEVKLAIDEIVNGFVFNFQSPLQIVASSMSYRSQELPDDWLERYMEGIQRVTPDHVRDVFLAEVQPDRMTILLVGDTTRFGGSPSELGSVTVLEERPSPPRGLPQSRR